MAIAIVQQIFLNVFIHQFKIVEPLSIHEVMVPNCLAL